MFIRNRFAMAFAPDGAGTAAASDAAATDAENGAGATDAGAEAKTADTRGELLGGDKGAADGKTILGSDVEEEAKDAGDGDREEGDSDKSDKADEEQVEYELKAPEGLELDEQAVEAFLPVAQRLKLSNEDAQELTDLHAKALKHQNEQTLQRHIGMVDGWSKETAADPEIGGDKLEETVRLGDAALKHAFDAETVKLLTHFGLLNHPGFIRGMRSFGQIVTDDNFIQSTGHAAPRSLAERMYPDMNKPQR